MTTRGSYVISEKQVVHTVNTLFFFTMLTGMTTRGSYVISEKQVIHTVNILPFRVVFDLTVYACRTSPVLRTLVAPSLAVSSRPLLLHHASEGDSEYFEPFPSSP